MRGSPSILVTVRQMRARSRSSVVKVKNRQIRLPLLDHGGGQTPMLQNAGAVATEIEDMNTLSRSLFQLRLQLYGKGLAIRIKGRKGIAEHQNPDLDRFPRTGMMPDVAALVDGTNHIAADDAVPRDIGLRDIASRRVNEAEFLVEFPMRRTVHADIRIACRRLHDRPHALGVHDYQISPQRQFR